MAQGLVEGFVLGAYQYRTYKTDDAFDGPSAFLLRVGDDHDADADEGQSEGPARLLGAPGGALGVAREVAGEAELDPSSWEAFLELHVDDASFSADRPFSNLVSRDEDEPADEYQADGREPQERDDPERGGG